MTRSAPRGFLSAALAAAIAACALPGLPAAAAPPERDPITCLALNVYWESRAEAEEDQLAVAWVTLNRVASPDFPDEVCAVVYQGGEASRFQCQFSWWCDGKPDTPYNRDAWERALGVARQAIAGAAPDPTDGALYFHNNTVSPDWARAKTLTARIGPHRFYK